MKPPLRHPASYRSRIYGRYRSARGRDETLEQHEAFDARLAQLSGMISRHFPHSRTAEILDLGCGDGSLIRAAELLGYQNVRGVDISPEQVRAARDSGVSGVTEEDLVSYLSGLSAESVDAVVTFDSLEHLTRDELVTVADEVHRVLKPSGRWVIHTCNAASPFFGAIRYGDLSHELAFTRTSMRQLLFGAGFASISCTEDDPAVHGAASAIRWILWKVIRWLLAIYCIVETGDRQPLVLTRNFFVVASK